MRKRKAITYSAVLLGFLSFFLLVSNGRLEAAQKKRGSINATLGIAKSNDKEKGNFGLLKSVGWNLLSGWVSGGINFGIVKNEILAMGNISLNIPLNRIEPFATAGYGVIIERFSPASNYGGGIRVLIGKHVGIVAEYRRIHFQYKDKQRHTESSVDVDYFGTGIFYYF